MSLSLALLAGLLAPPSASGTRHDDEVTVTVTVDSARHKSCA